MCWCGQIGCDGKHPALSPSAIEIAEMPPETVASPQTVVVEVPKPRCFNCRFYDNTAGYTGGGLCRRYAPVKYERRGWPLVIDSDWCGEFEPKPEAA
jgi:hypothetical protein